MAEAQARLQALSEDYQKLQQGEFDGSKAILVDSHCLGWTDLQSFVDSRQKLDGQRQENLSVQKVTRITASHT